MPGFGERIGEDRLWDLTNVLRAQAKAEEGKTMNASAEPWHAIVAPNFTFQIGRNPQTGKDIKIAASNTVRFKPGAALKHAVNGKAATKEK